MQPNSNRTNKVAKKRNNLKNLETKFHNTNKAAEKEKRKKEKKNKGKKEETSLQILQPNFLLSW